MGILLDSLKKKNFNVRKTSTYRERKTKMVALFKSATFSNRTNFMWDLVDPKQVPVLENQLLAESLTDPKRFARRLMEPDTLVKGKGFTQLAEKLEESLDEATLKAASEAIEGINISEDELLMDAVENAFEDQGYDAGIQKRTYLQHAMLDGEQTDVEAFCQKAYRDEKWYQKLSPLKKVNQMIRKGNVDLAKIVERSKHYIELAGDALTRAYTNAVSKVKGTEAGNDMDVMKDLLADKGMGSVEKEGTEAEGPGLVKGM